MKTYLDNPYYVVINCNYTATVANLDSLINYLDNVADIDANFGKIVKSSDECPEFDKALKQLIEERRAGYFEGLPVQVDRNQAMRDGTIIKYHKGSIYLEYDMPSGVEYINRIKLEELLSGGFVVDGIVFPYPNEYRTVIGTAKYCCKYYAVSREKYNSKFGS